MHEVEIGDETGDGRYCIVPQCRVDDQGLVERRNPLEAILADYLPPPGPPALATLHLPPEWYSPTALRPRRPGTFLHAVSRAQDRALRALADPAVVLDPVPNGVDVAAHRAPRTT